MLNYIHAPVTYKVGEWAYPRYDVYGPDCRLFVFDNWDDAKKFKSHGECIFECEISGGIRGQASAGSLEKFWQKFSTMLKNKKSFDNTFKDNEKLADIPAILAKKVKLTRQIQ